MGGEALSAPRNADSSDADLQNNERPRPIEEPMPASSNPRHTSAPARTIRIGLLLFPDFSMMALAAASEPLRAANRLGGRELYRWHLMSADGGVVNSSSGLTLDTESFLRQAETPDRVFVVASLNIEQLCDERVHHYLRQLTLKGTTIGALSTGTFVLARAGLLQGFRCTLHWESLRPFAEEFPSLHVCRELYVRDRNRLTCAGGTAVLDLMLDQIASDHGGQLAADVAEQFKVMVADYIEKRFGHAEKTAAE